MVPSTSPTPTLITAPTPKTMAREPPKSMCATDQEANEWAAGWWKQREAEKERKSVAGELAALYKDPVRLFGLLQPRSEDGLEPVKLVRGSWLLERAKLLRAASTEQEKAQLRMPRRQELERVAPHALLTPKQAAAIPRGHVGQQPTDHYCPCCESEAYQARKPLKLIAISHAWLTPEHPDPLGEQLVAFADVVARERRCCRDIGEVCAFVTFHLCCPWYSAICPPWGTYYGLPLYGQQCCDSAGAFPSGEFMVFYDYASLHQKDPDTGEKSEAEIAAFAAALNTMGTWYAHKLSSTFALDVLPPGWGTTPYSERGWTTFEAAVSALAKETINTSWTKHVRASVTGRQGEGSTRPPPLHPEAFAATLARKAFTNGKSDCELVAGLYADVFDGTFGANDLLIYMRSGWGDAEVAQLARVLPLARQARYLDLALNTGILGLHGGIGAAGWRTLAAAIEAGGAPRLEVIRPVASVGGSAAWPTSDGGALRAVCKKRGIKLGSLELGALSRGAAEVRA